MVRQLLLALLGLACGQTAKDDGESPPPATAGVSGTGGDASAGEASTAGQPAGESGGQTGGFAGGTPYMPQGGTFSQGGQGGQGGYLGTGEGAGCGMDPEQALGMFVPYTIETSGTKDADATGVPGPWSYEREYFVWLPPDYDNARAYPLVLQGPGCGGNGTTVYSLDGNGMGPVDGQVIRIGLTPPPNDIEHAVAPGGGCFDDREGDDSVEFPFYEAVMDAVRAKFCIDDTRVFATGNSSGAILANELGCKYAGHPTYPIRAIGVNSGMLPTAPEHRPTCSSAPMPGIWVHETTYQVILFEDAIQAVNRAMVVNGCTIGTSYGTAMFDPYPIGGGNPDDTCRKMLGCPDAFPIVVCELPGNGKGSHDNVVNPGFSVFFQEFSSQ